MNLDEQIIRIFVAEPDRVSDTVKQETLEANIRVLTRNGYITTDMLDSAISKLVGQTEKSVYHAVVLTSFKTVKTEIDLWEVDLQETGLWEKITGWFK